MLFQKISISLQSKVHIDTLVAFFPFFTKSIFKFWFNQEFWFVKPTPLPLFKEFLETFHRVRETHWPNAQLGVLNSRLNGPGSNLVPRAYSAFKMAVDSLKVEQVLRTRLSRVEPWLRQLVELLGKRRNSHMQSCSPPWTIKLIRNINFLSKAGPRDKVVQGQALAEALCCAELGQET